MIRVFYSEVALLVKVPNKLVKGFKGKERIASVSTSVNKEEIRGTFHWGG